MAVGHTYTIAAFNTYWTGPDTDEYSPALTQQFTFDDAAQLAVISRPPTTITYGASASFQVHLTRWSDGAALPSYPVELWDVVNDGPHSLLAHGTTGSTGLVTLTVRPAHTTTFSFNVPNEPGYDGAGDPSYQPRVLVRPVLSLGSTHHTYDRGRTAALTGTISPHLATTVRLQDYSHGAWHTVASERSSSLGHYAFHVHLRASGHPAYRVERSGDANLVTGVSATLHLTVR